MGLQDLGKSALPLKRVAGLDKLPQAIVALLRGPLKQPHVSRLASAFAEYHQMQAGGGLQLYPAAAVSGCRSSDSFRALKSLRKARVKNSRNVGFGKAI